MTKCEECKYWDGPQRRNESESFYGRCLRYPPTIASPREFGQWFFTWPYQKCGEGRPHD